MTRLELLHPESQSLVVLDRLPGILGVIDAQGHLEQHLLPALSHMRHEEVVGRFSIAAYLSTGRAWWWLRPRLAHRSAS